MSIPPTHKALMVEDTIMTDLDAQIKLDAADYEHYKDCVFCTFAPELDAGMVGRMTALMNKELTR